MAPSAPSSSLQETLNLSKPTLSSSSHPPYLHYLTSQILHDLKYQHDWTCLTIHTHSPVSFLPLSRPIISGLPPRCAYIHPDEQVEILKAEHATGKKIIHRAEREWVLPTHIQEKMTLRKFAEVFDGLSVLPPGGEDEGVRKEREGNVEEESSTAGEKWRGEKRQKRLLLSTLHDDSTVTYYIMHDGIVKPRQN